MLDSISVLVVDDEEINREMLSVMLDGLATSVPARNGLEALRVLEANSAIDLILLDLEMPELNGFATLATLKKHPLWCDIPVIVLTASKDEVTRTLRLGANDFLAKPYDMEELRLRVMNHVRTKKLVDLSQDVNGILEREVARKTAEVRNALAMAREAEYEITLRLGRAAEFRDVETGMHTRRISEMARELGRLSGLPADQCEVLRYAAPLHDVGKLGIPDRILLKPGRLTDEEMEIMRLHTVIGGKILANAERYSSLEMGRTVALQHHEKWDGTGYPSGLAGEDIHIFGRIVMIVDVFDALCSERPYKPALPFDEVLSVMGDGRASFFDPRLLDVFLANVEAFAAIRTSLMDRPVEEKTALEQVLSLA
ncbi:MULTISPECIES: HD domain-containing phosphohydrolase [Geobacter]|uniref:Chemotaxis protein CheY n=2 Tax=Geobacter TaxID=28231 RepID=A0A0C1U1C3_9BACT|nr:MULTISPECIES: HD domain-containing phosphohydrolase [Geobacter]ANA39780.1 two-component system response regulator [Geobacter anodireducens]KIE41580.1 chemotaxis protein CheY [Geobacter soli]MBE2887518.1 response regulator [Geobacter anodireducens]HMN01875.1 response regulator [Geobacter anodireducens]